VSARKLVTGATLLVLLLVLAGMAVYGFKAATAPLPGSGTAASGTKCTPAEKQVKTTVSRADVQVSVFNAGTKSGLAGTTLQKVEEAGFRAGNAGNAPANARVAKVIVWTTKPNDTSARLVALAFGRRTPVRVVTADLGPGIDVLVGNRFTSLDKKATKRLRLPKPVETCIKVN
jgi:hypothetical protein